MGLLLTATWLPWPSVQLQWAPRPWKLMHHRILAFVVAPDPNPGRLVAALVARPANPAIAAAAAASLPTIELAGDVVA